MRASFGLTFALVISAAALSAQAEQPHPSSDDKAVRLELAERYLSITNLYTRSAETYEKQIKGFWTFCSGKSCAADLDRAISETMTDIEPEYRRRMVQVYADHLDQGQLRTAIRFAESPEGRAVIEAERGMTGDVAAVGLALWKDVNEGVSRRFCKVRQELCVAQPSAAASASTPRSHP